MKESLLQAIVLLAGDDANKWSGQIVHRYPGATLVDDKRAFNLYRSSRTRMHIERAFGLWKERWGMFHRPSCLYLVTLTQVIKCTLILTTCALINAFKPPHFTEQGGNYRMNGHMTIEVSSSMT